MATNWQFSVISSWTEITLRLYRLPQIIINSSNFVKWIIRGRRVTLSDLLEIRTTSGLSHVGLELFLGEERKGMSEVLLRVSLQFAYQALNKLHSKHASWDCYPSSRQLHCVRHWRAESSVGWVFWVVVHGGPSKWAAPNQLAIESHANPPTDKNKPLLRLARLGGGKALGVCSINTE